MRIAVFSTHDFEKNELVQANKGLHKLIWIEESLNPDTAALAKDCDAIMVFANDEANAEALDLLFKHGVRYVTTRSAGYNHIDLNHARHLGIKVAYVPEYSPYAIAEHAIGLMLALNRHFIESDHRVSRYDFHVDGLTGFDMHGKTVGIIGAGQIGQIVARILNGFGCRVLAYDNAPRLHPGYELSYVSLDELCRESDIITLHLLLNEHTMHFVDKGVISKMKKGVMLINTSRGSIINTEDVLAAIQSGQIGYLGMDVYEQEQNLFHHDCSGNPPGDKLLKSLIEHPNVLITAHHAFLTDTALRNIAETSFYNINCWANGFHSKNELT